MDHGAGRRTVEEVDDPMVVPQKIMEEWEPQRIDELPEAFCGKRKESIKAMILLFVVRIIYLMKGFLLRWLGWILLV